MREILFRGKRLCDGEWVEGFYNHIPIGRLDRDEHMIQTVRENGKIGMLYDVYPSTVGQYTGLKDKNGKRIFEGDIVQYNTFYDFCCCSVVKFGEYEQDGSNGEYTPTECVGWHIEVAGFTCPDWAADDPLSFRDHLKQMNLLEVNQKAEVNGNIHDNPELIGGKL